VTTRAACIALALVAAVSGVAAGSKGFTSAAGPDVVGRVRVRAVPNPAAARVEAIRRALETPDHRVLSVTVREDDPARFDAVIWDTTVEKAFQLVVDGNATVLSREAVEIEPMASELEFRDAKRILAESAAFGPAIASGEVELDSVMPPSTMDAKGRRLLNVGVTASHTNEIVSVHVPTGEIVRYDAGAPPTARANAFSCGPGVQSCFGIPSGSCETTYLVEWPSENPVWRFNVTHPSCTTTASTDGTGLLVTDVYYNDELILQRAEVPVLNVQYHGNACGPYRDWLWQEDCFQADGVDVSSGIRVTTGNPTPSTFCETGSDAGNFKGVAIHDQGSYLWLMTESRAGWYRYVMEWKFYLDGTIEPVFGFGATKNSCTCNRHDHHSYWRFEWAIGGTSGNQATGINRLEHRVPGSEDLYTPVTAEGKFVREAAVGSIDRWRIQNPQSGSAYLIVPGDEDSTANGDAYADADLWALAYNTSQINDPNAGATGIRINSWINGEALGDTKRLVTWYHAGYIHDVGRDGDEACELVGPRLVPYKMCSGNIGLDRATYGCGAGVSFTLEDSDLAGVGTATVSVTSATETTPETITVTESPVGSGHFAGTFDTTSAPPVPGDGKLSVTDGGTLAIQYLDASSCGQSAVPVTKTATIDCASPAISSVAATNVRGKSAVITWLTSEPATGTVHFGTTPAGTSATSSAAIVSSHGVLIDGLAECTRYYYWVESTDPQGNIASSSESGGVYSFTTAKNVAPEYTSHDTPIVIPDNLTTGISSAVGVADADIVQDVNVSLDVTHAYDGDLTLTLTPPGGTGVTLVNRRGSYGENFTGTTFDDQATTPITSGTAPFTGSFIPESPLTVANGFAASGTWSLKAADQAISDVGTIDTWTLRLTYPSGSCAAQSVPPPATDSLSAARVNAGTIALTWDASTCPAPNYHLLHGQLASVSTYALAGSVCGLGPTGSYTWSGMPGGNVWYLIVADNGGSIESSWGKNGDGQEIKGSAPSNVCGVTARDNSATCP
jgi:subtilisin-like proprotein convertase family protein